MPVSRLRLPVFLMAIGLTTATSLAQSARAVQEKVNETIRSVSEGNKSYRPLFDAYLDMTPAPTRTGSVTPDFNVDTIHNGMDDWDAVRSWAVANVRIADIIIENQNKTIFGLPYGTDGLSQTYIDRGLVAHVGVDGDLRRLEFRYFEAIETILAFATADAYRKLEAGQGDEAVELILGTLFILDQLTGRDFLDEKLRAIRLMNSFLHATRDMMHVFRNTLTIDHFNRLAREIPFVRVDLMTMPSGDRLVAEALIESVFTESGEAEPARFVEVFAALQSREEPLTRFGAAKRWRMVSLVHSSRQGSLERLQLVYDDWWRRWMIRAYDPLLEIPTQYSRTNAVRYAAVTYAMRDIESLFRARRHLVANVNGTAMAAAVNGYRLRFGTEPEDVKRAYAVFILKRTDLDPYDRDWGPFRYRYISGRQLSINTELYGFIPVEGGILYSLGENQQNNRGEEHSDDGVTGDIVFWPALRAIARERGIIP